MENNDHGLLYDVATAWKELTGYCYVFTFGYKQQLYTINLSFPPERFPHLAGFQYLKDINLPRFNPSKTMNMILSGKISHSQIEKSSQYEESVKPRLEEWCSAFCNRKYNSDFSKEMSKSVTEYLAQFR